MMFVAVHIIFFILFMAILWVGKDVLEEMTHRMTNSCIICQ